VEAAKDNHPAKNRIASILVPGMTGYYQLPQLLIDPPFIPRDFEPGDEGGGSPVKAAPVGSSPTPVVDFNWKKKA
jgi:hypothetical protein